MNGNVQVKSKVKNQKYFVDDWLYEDVFSTWLVKDKNDNTKARCSVCHKTIELSSSGRSALTDHAKGLKHTSAVNKVSTFFQSKCKKSTEPKNATSKNSDEGNNNSTLDTFIVNSDTIKAEIIWSLKSVMNGFSNRANDELHETFAAMFPDSQIAKSFSLARTKSMYTVVYGLAPHFKSVLLSDLERSDIHVFSFDESLNEVTQTCEMDLYARFWEPSSNRVETRYFGSSFLGHSTHQDLYTHFVDLTKDLNSTKLYQISMDGPNVNVKFYKEYVSHLNEECHHQLLDIGSCSLHIIHGSLCTGEKKSEWELKKTLKGAYRILHDTPARREDYESVTGSKIYPFSFCSTRLVILLTKT